MNKMCHFKFELCLDIHFNFRYAGPSMYENVVRKPLELLVTIFLEANQTLQKILAM